MGEINVRALEKSDAETCDAIMRSLPEWFSFEPGLQDCARAVRTNEGWVAELDGQLIGFATWEERTPKTAEITWMATDREHRGNGVGTAIIETAAAGLSQRGYALVLAMTSAAHKVTVQYPLEGGDAYDDACFLDGSGLPSPRRIRPLGDGSCPLIGAATEVARR